jgi:hypothetical protein
LALFIAGLAGCRILRPEPSADEVHRLERALLALPCFRPIDRWWRSYDFRFRSAWDYLQPHEIEFTFLPLEARIPGSDAPPEDVIYDGPGEVAFGRLDTATRMITVEHCGPNFGGMRPAHSFPEP